MTMLYSLQAVQAQAQHEASEQLLAEVLAKL
jgi:hypothetical protein